MMRRFCPTPLLQASAVATLQVAGFASDFENTSSERAGNLAHTGGGARKKLEAADLSPAERARAANRLVGARALRTKVDITKAPQGGVRSMSTSAFLHAQSKKGAGTAKADNSQILGSQGRRSTTGFASEAKSEPLFDRKMDQDFKGVNMAGISYGDDARYGKDAGVARSSGKYNLKKAVDDAHSQQMKGVASGVHTDSHHQDYTGRRLRKTEGVKGASKGDSKGARKNAPTESATRHAEGSSETPFILSQFSSGRSEQRPMGTTRGKIAKEEVIIMGEGAHEQEERSIGRAAAARAFAEADAQDPQWSMGYAPESDSRLQSRRATAAATILNHYDDSAALGFDTASGKQKPFGKYTKGAGPKGVQKTDKTSDDETMVSAAFDAANGGAAAIGNSFKKIREAVEDKLEDSPLGKYFTGEDSTQSVSKDVKQRDIKAAKQDLKQQSYTFTSPAHRSTTGAASVSSAISSMFSKGASGKPNATNKGETIAHDYYNNPSLHATGVSAGYRSESGSGMPFYRQQEGGAFATASQPAGAKPAFGNARGNDAFGGFAHHAPEETSQSFGGHAGGGSSVFASTSHHYVGDSYATDAVDANPLGAGGRDATRRGNEDRFGLGAAKSSSPIDYSSPSYLVRHT